MMRRWAACIPLVAGGFAVGWYLHAVAAAAPGAHVHENRVLVGKPLAPDGGLDTNAIRAALREEIASALSERRLPMDVARSSVISAAPEVPAAHEPSAAQRDALLAIEGLIGGGVWTETQRLAFRENALVLSPEQREQAMQQLIAGINSGAIHLKIAGSPF
ncbi:MAG: hypothetical protein JSR66_02325 [Proteobacteria bacterium]|nr:hypothetical protein [Pseudomonadota bacterium]